MNRISRCAVFALATAGAALSSANAQSKIPVRTLSDLVTSDSTVLMAIAGIRALPNGGVVVNDLQKRQLVVYDSSLKKHTIIADTSANSPNSYGLQTGAGGLIPYVADSTLFVDWDSQAFLVIDPNGAIVRVMAPTRASDLRQIAFSGYGATGFDPKGRMIYRSSRSQAMSTNPSMFAPENMGKQVVQYSADSASLLRMDFDKRSVDTVGLLKVQVQKSATVATRVGGGVTARYYQAINPIPNSDEWTLLPDGTIAIVRSQDYHMDWLSLDGKMTSTPKMPFDWKRISLDEKKQIIDSLKKAEEDRVAKLPPPVATAGYEAPKPVFVTLDPVDLPDFYPAVRAGQVRADLEGNVWILPATSASAKGGLLYDVVNRKGEIFERVQLPAGRTLVGFGPKGTIYMQNVKSLKSAALERAQIVRPIVP